MALGLPYRALLDSLLGADLDDALHENPRGVHEGGIELAGFDDLLDLGDGDPPRGRAQRVEVLGGLLIDQVAVPIAVPRVDQRVVGHDGAFEDVVGAVEGPHLLGL
jgi:hypothetical protein